MKSTLLLPLDIRNDNSEAYCRAFELAAEKNADLFLLTTVPQANFEEATDEVYFHLLDLNGFFQTQKNRWAAAPAVRIKRLIQPGDLIENLKKYITENTPDWIVSNSKSEQFNRLALERLFPSEINYSIVIS